AEQAPKPLNRTKDECSHADPASAESWVRFFDETARYAMIGTVHTVLAQTADRKHTRFAIPALGKAIEAYGDDMARSKTFSMSALATNHLVEGDVDHGARIGRNAVDLAEHIKSKRTRDRMRPLRIEADKRANNSDARDLSELVTRFVTSS
ncbi:MAG: transcriptional regulator, partial [Sciscionella sp.]